MKYVCTFPCQLRGVRVRPETVLDLTDDEAKAPVVRTSFRPLAPNGLAVLDDGARDKFGMTRQDYIDKLAPFGPAAYGPADSLDQLRKTYERLTSATARKARKA